MLSRERRTFRLSCNAPVLIKVPQDGGQRTWSYSVGVAEDISMEGASVILPEPLQPGSSIELTFLPASDEAPPSWSETKKSATVVWLTQLTPLPGAPFRHGLRFGEPEVDLLFCAWPGERLSD